MTNEIPSHQLSWKALEDLKRERAQLLPNWENTQAYDRVKVLEDLITQITSYLVKHKIYE